MLMLLVSDLHYSLPQFDWVLDQASMYDAVVLAGDHLDLSSAVPLESQIVVVQNCLEELASRTSVLVCSGNHDLTDRNQYGEKCASWIERAGAGGATIDWHTLDLDDVRVTVCPWWDGPATRADVDLQLARDAGARPRLWIWIYHYPPDQLPVSWTGERHIGDADLRDWMTRHEPDLVMTGHIHDSPFRDGGSWLARLGATWVVNAGQMRGPTPSHVIVDSASGTAEWWSPYGQASEQLWPATVA